MNAGTITPVCSDVVDRSVKPQKRVMGSAVVRLGAWWVQAGGPWVWRCPQCIDHLIRGHEGDDVARRAEIHHDVHLLESS